MRILAAGAYGYDDVEVGDRVETETAAITAQMIDAFAALSGDRFEIHMDTGAAARHGFGARVAHGLLVLSVIDGLKNTAAAQFKARASLGWDWSFRAPVLAGDSVRAVIEVLDKRAITKPDQGILTLRFEVFNQQAKIVQDGSNTLLVYR